MKHFVYICIMIVLIVMLTQCSPQSPQGRYYDCRDAHWHPDYPVEVKQECARLRIEEWRRLNQETESKDRYI